jgi:hypothetical protein
MQLTEKQLEKWKQLTSELKTETQKLLKAISPTEILDLPNLKDPIQNIVSVFHRILELNTQRDDDLEDDLEKAIRPIMAEFNKIDNAFTSEALSKLLDDMNTKLNDLQDINKILKDKELMNNITDTDTFRLFLSNNKATGTLAPPPTPEPPELTSQ